VDGKKLVNLFPRLFILSDQKETLVGNVVAWSEGRWRWELKWRREGFEWERELIE